MAAPLLPNPVIVVPGITASTLEDAYSVSPETVWSVLAKDYERIAMHPDDPELRYEAFEPARLRPGELFGVAYKSLIEELRYNLSPKRDQPVPVYPFAYDWRRPLAATEAQLAAFIDEVIERTKLMPHYHPDFAKDPKVNLVGHSMGGLVIAGCLERMGKQARVGKVATLATPYRGSYEAVIQVTTGTANLGVTPPSSREREAARLTPALYHLLPRFERDVDYEPDVPGKTLFDSDVWQPSIVATLASFISERGLRIAGITHEARAQQLFASMLNEARAHRDRIEAFRPAKAGLGAKDWLAVVGVGAKTRVKLKVKTGDKPEFAFNSEDRDDLWSSSSQAERRLTGDGTVPFEGALPPFLKPENLVLVTPDDFGYWEIQDRLLTKAAGFHGMIPTMNMVHRLIVRFFKGAEDRYGNTWGRRAPGVARWNPPLEGELRDKDA